MKEQMKIIKLKTSQHHPRMIIKGLSTEETGKHKHVKHAHLTILIREHGFKRFLEDGNVLLCTQLSGVSLLSAIFKIPIISVDDSHINMEEKNKPYTGNNTILFSTIRYF